MWHGQHSLGWRHWRLIGVYTPHLLTTFSISMGQVLWQWTGTIGPRHAWPILWHTHDCVYTTTGLPNKSIWRCHIRKDSFNYKDNKKEPNRTRLAVGGNRMNYPEYCGTPTEELPTLKIIFNSTISTKNSKFMIMDIRISTSTVQWRYTNTFHSKW